MAEKKKENTFKIDDRVKRIGRPGCLGTVKVLREEVIGSSGESSKCEFLIKVQWDNGTLSYFAPESLEHV
jgi:hypothetical protein